MGFLYFIVRCRYLQSLTTMSKIPPQQMLDAIQVMLKDRKKRKFAESVDLQVNLKNYDVNKDKRFAGSLRLPPAHDGRHDLRSGAAGRRQEGGSGGDDHGRSEEARQEDVRAVRRLPGLGLDHQDDPACRGPAHEP